MPGTKTRQSLVIIAALLIPILPFVIIGEIPGEQWLSSADEDAFAFALAGSGLLTIDILLPIPLQSRRHSSWRSARFLARARCNMGGSDVGQHDWLLGSKTRGNSFAVMASGVSNNDNTSVRVLESASARCCRGHGADGRGESHGGHTVSLSLRGGQRNLCSGSCRKRRRPDSRRARWPRLDNTDVVTGHRLDRLEKTDQGR